MTMWVFGYGSLLWNPGFEIAQQHIAVLPDYARSFCMSSIHHRGTVENPGLVLALDHRIGTSCEGVVFEVAQGHETQTLAYLRERELVSAAYLEKQLDVILPDQHRVRAITYVIDETHEQYCKDLDLEQQAQIIARAKGGRGENCEYLFNTYAHLQEIGLHDKELAWLSARVTQILS